MGYKQRLDPRDKCMYYEHRALAAWYLGRPLQPEEVVHHVNGDPSDNHPDNIWVLSSQRAHMLMHHYLWREAKGVQHLFSLPSYLEAQGESLFVLPQRRG